MFRNQKNYNQLQLEPFTALQAHGRDVLGKMAEDLCRLMSG